MIKGIIFDFNGTLFLDDDINRNTWEMTINRLSEGKLDFDALYSRFLGIPNNYLIEEALKLCGKSHEPETIEMWSNEKEIAYRQYCRDHKRSSLNSGAEKLLDYLKEKGYPLNICTASIGDNVRFYFDNLNLYRWFDIDKVSYLDGTSTDKSEMYLRCADNISVKIDETLIFDDSTYSIEHAIEAGCKNIVAIRKDTTPSLPEIIQVIDDFTVFDASLLER